ncbi:MAG TPA: 3-deoxy-7-phosphoheptulonate synthase [Candidatus Dormibacteraeota bacterium]|jgi:3-deoxy-7-phosphoheptulonate synthase|nr:3-deoxy-7-phosphoheptulonate synthase [Candidatus Dormibacteraeota bacterium]
MLELEQSEAARPREVRVGPLTIGAGHPCVIAGPCSVEPQYVEHVAELAACGIDGLRGNIYKPRTRPESFQGIGDDGLELLVEARKRFGLPIFTEVLASDEAERVAGVVDCLWIGARNMQNFRLLEAVGQIGKPVLLKRGFGCTVSEWVGASEYIRKQGNDDVILCERGIRTFESSTRNTLDISSVVVVREMTDLPVIVDPSHAAGNRAWVPALGRAALAAGADGLLVEAHPAPALAWSDGDQAIDVDTCAELVAEAGRAAISAGRTPTTMADLALIDAEMARLQELRRQILAG